MQHLKYIAYIITCHLCSSSKWSGKYLQHISPVNKALDSQVAEGVRAIITNLFSYRLAPLHFSLDVVYASFQENETKGDIMNIRRI